MKQLHHRLGVVHQAQKGGKIRRELDNKVAYASFGPVTAFRKHKENVIASVYNTDELELRVKNGDGANWIQKDNSCECICCNLLLENRFDDLLECIKAYINSAEDAREKANLQELYHYYLENKETLAGYYDRGITILSTRNPGVIHHARLGSMEGNVFTIIGNRMKGRRACWSIDGGNRLAALLCKHYSVSAAPETNVINACESS